MLVRTALVIALATILGAAAHAAVTCPATTRSPVLLPETGASAKCQKKIAEQASLFVATRMNVLGKCMRRQEPGRCPTAEDTAKIEQAAMKATDKITRACSSGAQAGLATSFREFGSPGAIAACTLGQHVATTTVALGNNHGTPGRVVSDAKRDKCAKELGKQGTRYLAGALAVMNGCFARQMKQGDPDDDVADECLPAWSGGGAFVAPTDTKTARKLAALERDVSAAIARKCNLTDPVASIESLFACPGATTVADLQACIVCENQRAAAELFTQQNGAEFAALIEPGNSLQDAVDAASPGDKIFVLPGNYAEGLVIDSDELQLIGCGAATNDRPRLMPPATPGAPSNGVFASDVDGLVFQGLEVFDWEENGIFITGADGVTFRDVVGDGNMRSTYAIYPVASSNVVVEGCTARRIADAGIYVGQDDGVLVRYNVAEQNVAGIEIENSQFAKVYGNLAQHNTGGLLVFKLPGPPLQFSNDHEVFDNVSINNDTPNFGAPGTAVGTIPDGTGLLVLSNDTSDFHHNILQGNGTFGLAVIDQRTVNMLSPGSFNPESPDQTTDGNVFRQNLISGNGFAPDSTPPNDIPAEFATNAIYLALGGGSNCFRDNTLDDGPDPIGFEASVCP